MQGNPLNLTANVTTIAGSLLYADGIGAAARFHRPQAIASDGTNLFVSDNSSNTIRKIVMASGAVTTLAGKGGIQGSVDGVGSNALFNSPEGIVVVGTNLYVADSFNNTIRKIVIATGEVTTFAGKADVFGAAADGTGTTARFLVPKGIVSDGTSLYVVDSNNHSIRKIDLSSQAVSTLAGSSGLPGNSDGTGNVARFYTPSRITKVGSDLYITDSGNHTIRKLVIATGAVTTIAGTTGVEGSKDGIGGAASFNFPKGITSDETNLFIADTNNYIIRKIVIATGAVSTIAGKVKTSGYANGTAMDARFSSPYDITANDTYLYVVDSYYSIIRKVNKITGDVVTIAGNASGNGIGAEATFNSPDNITTDGTNLYVADSFNNTIRKIVIATREVSTLAGSPGNIAPKDGVGSAASFSYPAGITTDGTNLYITDNHRTIRKIVIGTGEVSTLAGSPMFDGNTDGAGVNARFVYPSGITTDGANLYVADTYNHTIRKIDMATSIVSTLAGTSGVGGYVNDVGLAAKFFLPFGITTDGLNLYVSDSGNHAIRKIVISTGEVTTLAGGLFTGDATDAGFNYPHGITTDGTNLYVANTDNSTIIKVVLATGKVANLAGSVLLNTKADGVGVAASFNHPYGITTDGFNLYVTDTYNNSIRQIQ